MSLLTALSREVIESTPFIRPFVSTLSFELSDL